MPVGYRETAPRYAAMILACCLLFGLALAQEKGAKISSFAVPETVEAGNNVTLACRVELLMSRDPLFTVTWYLTTPQGSKELYHRLQEKTALKNIVFKEDDSIEILNIQPSYSGTYRCTVNNYNEDFQEQELIVYTPGGGPNLTVTAVSSDQGNYIQVDCAVEGAAPEPELVISLGELKINETYAEYSNESGTWNACANASLASPDDSTVRCELFFRDPRIPHEPYVSTQYYSSSGGAPTSTEAADTTVAADHQTGFAARKLLCSWLIVLGSFSLLLL